MVHGGYLALDRFAQLLGVGEGHVGEPTALEGLPAALDVVRFGSVFVQPFWSQPVTATGQGGERDLAPVDWPVVEDNGDGLARADKLTVSGRNGPLRHQSSCGVRRLHARRCPSTNR